MLEVGRESTYRGKRGAKRLARSAAREARLLENLELFVSVGSKFVIHKQGSEYVLLTDTPYSNDRQTTEGGH